MTLGMDAEAIYLFLYPFMAQIYIWIIKLYFKYCTEQLLFVKGPVVKKIFFLSLKGLILHLVVCVAKLDTG